MIKKYPLIFSYQDLVEGNGFVARVEIQGRVLLCDEGDGFWMYGVHPGGVAGGGTDCETAMCQFKENYMAVLLDIAEEASTFSQFKSQVEEEFFSQDNPPNAIDWFKALAEVRKTGVTLKDLNHVPCPDSMPACKWSISKVK